MRYTIALTLLCFGLSCGVEQNRAQLGSSRADTKTAVLRPLEARLSESSNSLVDVRETRIRSALNNGSIRSALFVTGQKGWAHSGRSVFRTADGGATWSRLSFSVDERSEISSFTFADESRGWLAVTKQRYMERYGLGNSSQIWATNDGGDTWYKQADFPDEVILRQLSFLNANDGFAIGARMIDQSPDQGPPYAQILVLSTADGGGIWTDFSEGAKEEIRKQMGLPADYAFSLHWRSPTDGFLLTEWGRILQTSDQGKTWKTIVTFKDERPNGWVSSVGYYKLVFDTAQRIRILAGSIGDHGHWADFVVHGDDDSWRSYELRRHPISDAIFLSRDEVVACGQSIRAHNDNRNPPISGVILRSMDSGQNWEVIYRSKINETFVSLTKVNDREFYAVSDRGAFLRFELK